MSTARRQYLEHRRATAAVSVLIALVALQLVVAAALLGGTRDADIADKSLQGLRSQYAADSGLQMSLREAFLQVDEDADGTIGSVSNDGNSANNPTISSARAVTTASIAGANTTITATGSTTEAARKVSATVRVTAASGGAVPGLLVEAYRMSAGVASLGAYSWTLANAELGVAMNIYYPNLGNEKRWATGPNSYWALRCTGNIEIPVAGTWTFYTTSDDGSDLWINGTRVVVNDFPHGSTTRSGTIALTAGTHSFVARMFENTGSSDFRVQWKSPSAAASSLIPPTAFSFSPASLPHGVLSNTVQFTGNGAADACYADAFDSGLGAYGPASIRPGAAIIYCDSITAGAWQMSAQARLDGQAWIRNTGNTASVISLSTGATITGSKLASTQDFSVMRDYAQTIATSGVFNNSGTYTLAADTRYTSYQLSGAASTLTVSGNRTLYVDGNFTLLNAAQIIIPAGSSLRIYVGGNFAMSNTSQINTTTGLPNNCWVAMTGAARTVTIANEAKLCAHLRGYDAAVTFSGTGTGSEFFGTIRAKSLVVTDNAKLHFDVNAGAGSTTSIKAITASADVQ